MSCDDKSDILGAMSTFGIELYAELIKSQQGSLKNTFMCPSSIFAALTALKGGARGSTESELCRLLHISKLKSGNSLAKLFEPTTGTILSLANCLFVQQNVVLKTPFLDHVRNTCSMDEPISVDYEKNTEAARTVINNWVKEKTKDKITELFPKDSISTDTSLIVSNAVYFKGLWQNVFDKSHTQEGPFTLLDGSKKKIKFMFQNDMFKHGDFPFFELVKLPFKDSPWEMVIIMPHEHNELPKLLDELQTPGKFKEILQQEMYPEMLDLHLPRFKLSEAEVDVKKLLHSMDVKTLFCGTSCNLTGIVDDPKLFVKDIKHKAVLEVNEEGATAAGATGVRAVFMCMPQTLHINNPFVVAIVYKNDTPVFLGHVVDPEVF